jgi:hypothetical protein
VSATQGDWTPAFPGQRPPLCGPPGNELALQHGVYSERRLAPVMARLVAERLDDPATAYLRQPAYRAALESWARAEARVALLDTWLQRHVEETDGCVGCEACEPKADQLLKFEKNATTQRGRLGLDPLSRARLGRHVAAARVDMARLLSGEDERDGDDGGDDDG